MTTDDEPDRIVPSEQGSVAFPGSRAGQSEAAIRGVPISYVARDFTEGRSWQLLSASTKRWAENAAGETIQDPHSLQLRHYWSCTVRRNRADPGPGVPEHDASFSLFIFGKRGLAAASGTTSRLVEATSATKWRWERWSTPIDGTRVRSSHLSSASPNTAEVSSRSASGDVERATSAAARVVPSRYALWFGNLPVETQLHLYEPFLASGSTPRRVDLDATVEVVDGRYRETYRAYLASGRWMAFVSAVRSVPHTSRLVGERLWSGSADAEALNRALWAVAAWTAPVVKVASQVEPSSNTDG